MTTLCRLGVLGNARIVKNAILRPAATMPKISVRMIASRSHGDRYSLECLPAGAEIVTDYRAVTRSDGIDAVYIALPLSAHGRWVEQALRDGKHVLCEKPLTLDAASAEHLHRLAHKSGLVLQTAYHNVRHPAYAEFLRECRRTPIENIDGVALAEVPERPGEIRYRKELQGGALADLGCYVARTLFDLRDDLSITDIAICEWTERSGVDVTSIVDLTFADGQRAKICSSLAHPHGVEARIEARGPAGAVQFTHLIEPHRDPRYATGEAALTKSYDYQLRNFAKAVLGKAPISPQEGAADIAIARFLAAIFETAHA